MTITEFMRYSAPDADLLVRGIAQAREKLACALREGNALKIVDSAADLGSMLTTARMEAETVVLLQEHARLADALPGNEPVGWYWNAYATALQYCSRRDEAEHYFSKALEIAKQGGWRTLEAMVLAHWGRCMVEQGRPEDAATHFSEALVIRIELNDPRQESLRRALDGLAKLREA